MAWLSEPETAAMGAAEGPKAFPRSRPRLQLQLLALDQTPGAGLPTHPMVVMDQVLMLLSKRLPW